MRTCAHTHGLARAHTADGSSLEQIIGALDFTFVSIFTFELGLNLISNWKHEFLADRWYAQPTALMKTKQSNIDLDETFNSICYALIRTTV
jgi:hypothetical protein